VLRSLTGRVRGTWDGAAYSRLGGRHGAGGGNALRAAVLGANDGLVSNLSLVMGVAGAAFSRQTVLVTGLARLALLMSLKKPLDIFFLALYRGECKYKTTSSER
jgi:hypothetical protein